MSSDFALTCHDHDIYTSAVFIPEPGMDYSIGEFYDLTHGTSSSICLSGIHEGAGSHMLESLCAEVMKV